MLKRSLFLFLISLFVLTGCEENENPIKPDFTYKSNGATVVFSNKTEGADSYLWKFGDGTTSREENPIHVYDCNVTTTYEVTLVAGSRYGYAEQSITKSITITVKEQPGNDEVAAGFTFSPKSPEVGDVVSFTNTSRNAKYFEWDFDNGKTSTNENPTTTFAYEGTYTVTLTAYSDFLRTKKSQITKTINVKKTASSSLPTKVFLKSYKVNSISFTDEDGRYWDDSSSDGPDIYLRIYDENDNEIFNNSSSRKTDVSSRDLPFTQTINHTLNNLAKKYTFRLCDYDPFFVDYMYSFVLTPSDFIDSCPTTLYAESDGFSIELYLEWK